MLPPRIKLIEFLDNYILNIIYVNGEKRIYDMKNNLEYDYFKQLKDINYFKKAKPVGQTIEWPNGEDINPDELYYNGTVDE